MIFDLFKRPSQWPGSASAHNAAIVTVVFALFVANGCSSLKGTASDTPTAPEYDPDFTAYEQTIPGTNIRIDMVPVLGGTFTMGRAEDEPGYQPHEGPQREVAVESFWMTAHEITWDQYDLYAREVIEANRDPEVLAAFAIDPEAITAPSPPYGDATQGMGRDNRAAINMTHYAAVVYAMWLTAKTGEFYRLPTEAEWEFACRGGVYGGYDLQGDADLLEEHEWWRDNSDGSYNPVATKNPNPLGLFDMKGNIAEWTMDEFKEDYHEILEGDVADNPLFLPEVLYPRAVRGASFMDSRDLVRCTHRRGSNPSWKRGDPQIPKSNWWHTDATFVGFRLVRPKETPSREEMERYWIMPILDF